jgi:hypothetical protein
MENYELTISAPPKRQNGYFPKGHKPFNKGLPMKDWMDGRKIKKVMKYLEIGRGLGNSDLPGANRIPIVGIKDGKLFPFKSSVDAANILKAKGVKVNAKNIRAVCLGTVVVNGKYSYVRKRAGGFQWFVASEVEKYKDLVK